MIDNKTQSGFALLIALVVVSAVLSIGLVILDLSIKQVRLAATTKDSEIAFHAANAGKECAQYWRRNETANMTAGLDTGDIQCFGENVGAVSDTGAATSLVDDTSDGNAYMYEYEFTWNGGERCSSISTLVVSADSSGDGVQLTNMQTLIPGYPSSSVLDCDAGTQCTVVAAKGYNKSCAQKASFGTIERELLLNF